MQEQVIASTNVTANIKVCNAHEYTMSTSLISNNNKKIVMESDFMKEIISNTVLASNHIYCIDNIERGTSLTCYYLLDQDESGGSFLNIPGVSTTTVKHCLAAT